MIFVFNIKWENSLGLFVVCGLKRNLIFRWYVRLAHGLDHPPVTVTLDPTLFSSLSLSLINKETVN
jgi:hypothetical protein